MFGSLRKRAPPWAIKDEPKEIDSTERQPFNLALVTEANTKPGGLLAQRDDGALHLLRDLNYLSLPQTQP